MEWYSKLLYIFSLIQVTDNSLKFEMVYYFYTTLYMISILSLRPWNLNLKKPTQPIGYSKYWKPEYFDVEFFHIYIFSAYTNNTFLLLRCECGGVYPDQRDKKDVFLLPVYHAVFIGGNYFSGFQTRFRLVLCY